MQLRAVAPFTGAWIEIWSGSGLYHKSPVAPFTGAWIEIKTTGQAEDILLSLPSRERGLKYIANENTEEN